MPMVFEVLLSLVTPWVQEDGGAVAGGAKASIFDAPARGDAARAWLRAL